jgi:hypothetical protein
MLLSARISSDVLDWIQRSPLKSSFKRLFLETRSLLVPILSANVKSPPEGLKDLECKQGNIINRPPIPYVEPADLNKKQEMTKIKVKLPDGINYQMAPFQAGNNEDYVSHILVMRCLLEQKETEDDIVKAFETVVSIKDKKLAPLLKCLNMSKVSVDKEELKPQIDSVNEEIKKARKEALHEIVKAYELLFSTSLAKLGLSGTWLVTFQRLTSVKHGILIS